MEHKQSNLYPTLEEPSETGSSEAPSTTNGEPSPVVHSNGQDADVAVARPRPQLSASSPGGQGFRPSSSDDDEINAEIASPAPRCPSPPPNYPDGMSASEIASIPRNSSTDSMSSLCSTDQLIPNRATVVTKTSEEEPAKAGDVDLVFPNVDKPVEIENADKIKNPGTSLLASSFNSANFIIGVAILTYPNLFERQGIVLQLLISGFACLILTYTASVLMQCNELAGGVPTYSAIMEKVFGNSGRRIFDCSQGFSLFVLCVALTLLLGDFGNAIARSVFDIDSPTLVKFVLCQCIVYPLALLPNTNALRFTSILSISLVFFVVICVIQDSIRYMFDSGPDDPEPVYLFKPSMSIFQSLPIAIFSFQGHIILFPIYHELRNRRLAKMKTAVQRSFGSVFSMYVLLGIFGYLRLRRNIPGNALNAYTDDDEDRWMSMRWIMFCAAFAMMITVALSFPLYIFACKQIWLGIVYGNDHVASRFKSNVFASLIFYGSFLCGMFFSDILTVIGILGSVTAPLVVFIMPACMALKLRVNKETVPWYKDSFAIKCILILILAAYLVISGLAYSILSFF
eukprot:TRINITY_DN644_c0_g1_i1.p1 TRINITY_DN644_c0_g1~~TRINITY_DN644_c0_g1_i1.p1  ORF type:complete len:570 (-),score=141.54 TRINITY_DN644_c0_g1_i1:51-1760(-)